MGIFNQHGDRSARADATSPGQSAEAVQGRRRSPGIWGLILVNVLLAGLALAGLRLLAGAQHYLQNESVEFGRDLQAASIGLLILRIAAWCLVAGFTLAALGVLSLSRVGWRLQSLWALLLCLTLAGLVYGVPVLVFLRRPGTRSLVFPER